MDDPAKARRLRISNALMAVWFVCLACVLGFLTRDELAGVMLLALLAAGYAVGVVWMDRAGVLSSGKLSPGERRVVQIVLTVAGVLALAALVLAASEEVVALALAALAAAAAIITGAFSTWLAVR